MMQKELNAGFILSPIFVEWALSIVNEFSSHDVNVKACGFLGGQRSYFDTLQKENTFALGIHYNHALEEDFLRNKPSRGKIAAIRSLFGDKVIKELIIADRQLGSGYITGGFVAGSPFYDQVHATVENQESYVINLLDHLYRYFQEKKIDLFIAYSVAGAFSLACFHVCKKLNIPFFRISVTRLNDLVTFDSAPDDQFMHIGREYQARRKNLPKDEQWLKASQFLEQFRNKPAQPQYQVVQNKVYREKAGLKHFVKTVLKFLYTTVNNDRAYFHNSPRENHRLEIKRILNARRVFPLFREAPKDLLSSAFYYYPLHVEPEASTMVLSPMQTNQVAVIEAIAKAIPVGSTLVVKEHLTCIGKRPYSFYKQLAAFPNVLLITPFFNTFDLIKNAAATLAITGTAAWEAVLLNKPAVVVGKFLFPFFTKGYIRETDLTKLAEILSSPLAIDTPSDDELQALLSAVMNKSFSFPSNLLWYTGGTRQVVADNHAIVKAMVNNIMDQLHEKENSPA